MCLCRCAPEAKQASLYGAFDGVASEGGKKRIQEAERAALKRESFQIFKLLLACGCEGGQQRHSLPLSLSLRDSAAGRGSLWGKTLGGQTAPHLYPQRRQYTNTHTDHSEGQENNEDQL